MHSKTYYEQFCETEFLFQNYNIREVIEVAERKKQPSSLNDDTIRTIDDAYKFLSDWNKKIERLTGIYQFLLKLNHPIEPYNPERFRIIFK